MKFTAAGDMIIQRRIHSDFEGYEELAPFINKGDAKFFNLETTLNRIGETCVSQFSGGTYLRTNPEVLEDIKRFGFNMTSFNNNHALDYSYEGFKKTLEAVEASGLVHSGAGNNLAEASAPKYLETKNGRVALISVNTTFDEPMMAGEQTPIIQGRPGINGLRINSHVELPREELEFIKRIAKETKINASREIIRKEGYYAELTDNEAELGTLRFVLADEPKYVMEPDKSDMARVERAIYEAKLQADYIVISIHSHELSGTAKENPSEFLQEFSHRCIDLGANAIVGHGPHLLRPVEIYKNSPIFYSLGDFVLQLYNVEIAPQEFFEKQGLQAYESTVHELLKKRSKDFTIGLMTDIKMFYTVIPYWEMQDGKLTKLLFMPIEILMDGHKSEIGLPRRSNSPELIKYFTDMCVPYGTKLTLNEDGLLEAEIN